MRGRGGLSFRDIFPGTLAGGSFARVTGQGATSGWCVLVVGLSQKARGASRHCTAQPSTASFGDGGQAPLCKTATSTVDDKDVAIMSWACALLGPTLLVKQGGRAAVAKPTDEVLSGKHRVLLYFSASWCPPCKKFTPVLATCYDDAREEHADAVEVVYIGSDFDEGSFTSYYGAMPWASLPWGPASTKLAQELGVTFGVSGIPTLVALAGADGGLVTVDARAVVQREQSLAGLGSMPAGAPAVRGRRASAPPGGEGPSLVGLLVDLLTCGLCSRPRSAAKAAAASGAGGGAKTQ